MCFFFLIMLFCIAFMAQIYATENNNKKKDLNVRSVGIRIKIKVLFLVLLSWNHNREPLIVPFSMINLKFAVPIVLTLIDIYVYIGPVNMWAILKRNFWNYFFFSKCKRENEMESQKLVLKMGRDWELVIKHFEYAEYKENITA